MKQKTKQKQTDSQSGKIVGDICATLMIKSFYFIIDFFKSLYNTSRALCQERKKIDTTKQDTKKSIKNKDITREMYIAHQKENNKIYDKKMKDAQEEFVKKNEGGIY